MRLNMKNALRMRNASELPKTYDRGCKPIDIIAISSSLPDEIVFRSGMLPFYEGNFSDHRSLYVDIRYDLLFNPIKSDTTKQIYKRFTTENAKMTDQYLQEVVSLHEENRIFKKIDELENDIQEYLHKRKGNEEDLIQRCQRLSEKTSQLMIASERKLGRKHYEGGYPYSSKLRLAAKAIFDTKASI